MTALYSEQSRRDADFAEHFHYSGGSGPLCKNLKVASLTSCETLNCLSSEGTTLLLSHVHDKTCITAQQTIPDSPPEEVARALAALKATAKETKPVAS